MRQVQKHGEREGRNGDLRRGGKSHFIEHVPKFPVILACEIPWGVSVFEDEGFLSMRMMDRWLPSLLLLLLAGDRERVVSFTNYRWSYSSYVCGG